MKLEDKLTAALEEFDMLPRPAMKVAAGVSGGADSVALLLSLLEFERAPRIVVCHFNHRLRGSESDRDADFVEQLCEKHGLPFELRSADTLDFAKQKRLSLEHAARELRYEFFREICEKTGADRIATAHTMDDRAETVLMRMIRGSGVAGMSSIKPRSGNLIRPFFAISRAEVEEYLGRKNARWVEDGSNDSEIFTRNRIRKQVVPLLEGFNPQIKTALNRLADTADRQSSYISDRAAEAFAGVFPFPAASGALVGAAQPFRALHPAVRTEVLRIAYSAAKGGLERLDFSHLEDMDALLMSTGSGSVSLPAGVSVEKRYDVFCVSGSAALPRDYEITVENEGVRDLPGGISARFEKTSDTSLWGKREVGHFSLETTGFPVEVRNFRPGDRTVPLGMKGTKKLKSVFADRKIPSFLRNRLPVFTCKGEIIWAGGVVVSDCHKAVRGREHLRIELSGAVLSLLDL